jgi:hypothetical protein
MELTTDIKCLKCFSSNSPALNYCRYCHAGFDYSQAAPGSRKAAEGIAAEITEAITPKNRTLLIAAGSSLLVLAAAYLIFR